MWTQGWKSYWADESGVESIEYAFIIGGMALVILPAMIMLTGNLTTWGDQLTSQILTLK